MGYNFPNITTDTIDCMQMKAGGGRDGNNNICNIFVGAEQGQRGPSNYSFPIPYAFLQPKIALNSEYSSTKHFMGLLAKWACSDDCK